MLWVAIAGSATVVVLRVAPALMMYCRHTRLEQENRKAFGAAIGAAAYRRSVVNSRLPADGRQKTLSKQADETFARYQEELENIERMIEYRRKRLTYHSDLKRSSLRAVIFFWERLPVEPPPPQRPMLANSFSAPQYYDGPPDWIGDD